MTTGPTETAKDFRSRDGGSGEAGSVTPLIVGMTLCLLILGAGVTAAGSAFLAGQRLQHLCDGAAATAAGKLTESVGTEQEMVDAVGSYLTIRDGQVATFVQLTPGVLTLTCTADSPITFGALFATPTLHRTVTSTARANRIIKLGLADRTADHSPNTTTWSATATAHLKGRSL